MRLLDVPLLCHEVHVCWSKYNKGSQCGRYARMTVSKADGKKLYVTTGDVTALTVLDRLRCKLFGISDAGDTYCFDRPFMFRFSRFNKFIRIVSSK